MIDKETIRKLPKTDLHVHLDGSLRLETLLELAEAQKVRLPAEDEAGLRHVLRVGEPCRSLEEYLEAFEVTLSVLQTREALARAAYELAEDAAGENVWYMEIRYSPILHTRGQLRLTEVNDAVLEGLARAGKDFGIRTKLIICGIRSMDPATSLLLAELAVAYKNRGVVAFDLAGREHSYPAKEHREAFYLVVNNNINCTIHAGEAYGPESIAQAIHYCKANRIGHGTRLKEDGDLLNYVNDHRIPLEICVTSNVQTHAVPSLEAHPLRFYYDYGLRVTVNTDNRLISNTTVTDELCSIADSHQFTLPEIKNLILYGFKSAFLPYRDKVNMLHRVIEKLKTIEDDKPLSEAARLAG
ncbi:MAG TPA: adenosine deaminase [Firmicutes bacterium]|nr:adenosine deaminase [Bacillota bacterium]